jgi:hypothetical protein
MIPTRKEMVGKNGGTVFWGEAAVIMVPAIGSVFFLVSNKLLA